MSLRSKPLWPAIPGGHPACHRCTTLKMAPGHFLAVWLMCALVPAVSLAQTPGDRDLIRERQERLQQEQERRLDELRQLPGKVEQLPAQPVAEDERCFAIEQINLVGATLLSPVGKRGPIYFLPALRG